MSSGSSTSWIVVKREKQVGQMGPTAAKSSGHGKINVVT